jgi:hypothetical protein
MKIWTVYETIPMFFCVTVDEEGEDAKQDSSRLVPPCLPCGARELGRFHDPPLGPLHAQGSPHNSKNRNVDIEIVVPFRPGVLIA